MSGIFLEDSVRPCRQTNSTNLMKLVVTYTTFTCNTIGALIFPMTIQLIFNFFVSLRRFVRHFVLLFFASYSFTLLIYA